MNRVVTIATIIGALKQTLVKRDDFIEFWVINELIDDEVYRKLIEESAHGNPFSVLRCDYEQFDALNNPHGTYDTNHIKVTFGNQDIYVNVDAIYSIAVPDEHLVELNRRFEGASWEKSNTPGYITLNVSHEGQAEYFK